MIWIRIRGDMKMFFAISLNHTSNQSGKTNHLYFGVQVNCLRWQGMIVTQMCYKERKSRGGRRGGASEVRSAGTTLSFSLGSARSRRHKQSLEPMESMAHKKLWSIQCLACQVLQDYFRVNAVVQKLRGNNPFYSTWPAQDSTNRQLVFGI